VSVMAGEVVHFEIPVDDEERAGKFYSSAFGWKLDPMPELQYTSVRTTPTDESGRPSVPGSINGGMLRREGTVTSPVVTIAVEDIDEALANINSLGGATVTPREEVAGMGWAAYFRDTEGNVVGLWQNAMPEGSENAAGSRAGAGDDLGA
jgi:predicted enzyme related to lactoylglutathione lyase